jgi:hypothetical protein
MKFMVEGLQVEKRCTFPLIMVLFSLAAYLAQSGSQKLNPVITKAIVGSRALTRSELAILNEMLSVVTKYESSVVLTTGAVGFLPSSQFLLQYKLDNIQEWNSIAPGADIVLSRLSPTRHSFLYVLLINQ